MTRQPANWRLLTLITDADKRHKVESIVGRQEPLAYFSVRAKGSLPPSWFRQLGIKDSAKMQFEFLLSPEREEELRRVFAERLKIAKPAHGITFSTEVLFHIGKNDKLSKEDLLDFCKDICRLEEKHSMYKKICVIVDLGLGDDIIEAARKAGVRGGTILRGQGSASSEHATLFGIQLAPEKEMVIMLMPNEVVNQAILEINEQFKLDGIGNGILYVQDILHSQGLVEEHLNE